MPLIQSFLAEYFLKLKDDPSKLPDVLVMAGIFMP